MQCASRNTVIWMKCLTRYSSHKTICCNTSRCCNTTGVNSSRSCNTTGVNSSIVLANRCSNRFSNHIIKYYYSVSSGADDSDDKLDDSSNNSDDYDDNNGEDNNNNNNNNSNNNNTPNTDGDSLVNMRQALSLIKLPDIFPNVPIIILDRNPIFPKFVRMVELSDPELIKLIRRKVKIGHPYAGAFLRRLSTSSHTSDVITDVCHSLDEIYSIGTFVQITDIHEFDNKLRLILLGHRRINITGIYTEDSTDTSNTTTNTTTDTPNPTTDTTNTTTDTTNTTTYTPNPTTDTPSPTTSDTRMTSLLMVSVDNIHDDQFEADNEIKALSAEIVKTIRDIMRLNQMYKESLSALMEAGRKVVESPSSMADFAAVLSSGDAAQLQQVLEEANIKQRLSLGLELIKQELAIATLQNRLGKEVEDKVNKMQRKYLLQEQLKIIKKELGLEKDDKDQLADKFQARMNKVKPPSHVVEVFEEEMNKLSLLDNNSSEYSVTRNYLDWLTCLPWGVSSEENINISKAKLILDEDHYGLNDIKERILEFIAISQLKGTVQGKILCLCGPPGVGKTSVGRSIARALNREYYRFSVGGMSDVAEIKGHRRTYVGAMPGKIIQALKKVQTENPLILIDEVDKLGRGYQGDPASALLELLDPEQNAYFLDHYLDIAVDLSKVLFICTANIIDPISNPLQDRMEIIHVFGYVPEEKLEIAKRYLIPEASKLSGVSDTNIAISDGSIQTLVKYYCRESGVRNLQKHIEKVFRKVARKLVEQDSERSHKLEVTNSNLVDYVGQPVFTSDRLYETTPPGVVLGLAWTAMGGSTLYIEAINKLTPPNPPGSREPTSLQLTGSLGDVMKESAQIAHTFARHFLKTVSKEDENLYFDNNSIHLHVPEGATPKDGPSAGVTMVTALISLATNEPIRKELAMTGEISLTGKVLPVGGIKEKIIAAKREGVKTIILPDGNTSDFKDLSDFIRQDIEVHFVKNYAEIYRIAFGK